MPDLDWLQWPAMAVTICAAWLTASSDRTRREWGFRTFLASNLLWTAWGWHAQAWAAALILMAFVLRGMRRNDPEATHSARD